MAHETLTIVKAIHNAQKHQRWEQLQDLLHPEVMAYEPEGLPYAGFYRGYDGFLDLQERIRATWDGLHVEVDRYLDAGEWIVAMIQTTGRARATGTPFMMPVAEFWLLRGGRAVEVRHYYWDTAALRAILG